MVRNSFLRVVAAIIIGVFSTTVSAQSDSCMDCVEKLTMTTHPDGTQTGVQEAMCCLAPCAGGYSVAEADVGWGCLIEQFDLGAFKGTNCVSSNADLGCPPPPPPPPPPAEPADKCDGQTGMGQPCSPLVINLDNGPFELSGAESPVEFDITADGWPNRITWTKGGVALAFLAKDRNGNGRIDDGSELFGNFTKLCTGTSAENGFEALREFDTNDDGLVDSNDDAWPTLLLWIDTNHDGVSQVAELSTLPHSDVMAIETNYHWSGRRDHAGNIFRFQSQVHMTRGMTPVYDVYFRELP